MDIDTGLIYDTKRKLLTRYPRFGSEIAVANIEFRDDLPFHTATTDGRNIYVDPNYFASLNENDRLFIIAHEILHIKFMHMYRLLGKDGQKRDPKLWNIATDAIINANLERDGFTIKEGYVNMPQALEYTTEQFYEILLQEKQQEQEEQMASSQNGNENSEQGKIEGDNDASESSKGQQTQGDDHTLWEEAFERQQDQEQNGKNPKQQEEDSQNEGTEKQEPQPEFDEKNEFEKNREEKIERFKERRKQTEQSIRGDNDGKIELGDIGESKEVIDWKLLLRREVERTETIWSQRRSIAENNYAYRLEENDVEDEAETEVMIDVSGSVNLELVKAFLRQVKPILKQSRLKVGCFNERFWGFVDIKSEKDIDNFTIPRAAKGSYAWTEDWDLAVRSFTKRREINKIVFTDGYPCPGTMPKNDLKNENVIWIVYGNQDFNPCCGKVINITGKQLDRLHQVKQDEMSHDEYI